MRVKLKDIATIVGGATPSTEYAEYYNGNIIWITPKDLADNKEKKYIAKGERTITKLGFQKSNTNMIPAYNILISTRAPIGYMAINTEDCCTNQGFKSLICDKEKVNVDFLYYFLQTKVKAIEKLGTGTTFKEVSKSAIEEFEIDLPNRKTQDKIAEILSGIDDQIIRNDAMTKKLQVLGNTIYGRWFGQFEYPNTQGKPYKSSGGKMVWSSELKQEIPDGWDIKTLGNLLSEEEKSKIQVGEAKGNDGIFPFFTSGEEILLYKDYFVDGPHCYLNTGGNADVKFFDGKASYSTDTWCVSFGKYTYYINEFLQLIKPQIDKLFFSGSGLQHLQKESFKQLKLCVPDDKVLTLYNRIVSGCHQQIAKIYIENNYLQFLKNNILPPLINGQLNI